MKHPPRGSLCWALLLLVAPPGLLGQQVPDSAFRPPIEDPAYPWGMGPVVMIDEAHHNFHTAGGRYHAFAQLLRRDGYRVMASSSPFTFDSLNRGEILVISNALNERNEGQWSLPTPSAFTGREVRAVVEWVRRGGSLLLIADHMPFPGAAEELAARLGFRLNNGFAFDTTSASRGTYFFRRSDATLADHPITRGRSDAERIDFVVSFTGEAFQGDGVEGLMVFGPGAVSVMPEVAWEFNEGTPSVDVTGWYQGAVKRLGEGRVAVFGEAAMFSAQLAGPERSPAGMNDPSAPHNAQFLLNLMHWLSGII